MIFNKLISIKRYKQEAKDERGMFLVLVAIMLFLIVIFLAILVDIYVLLQHQMDMKIAAQMISDSGLRYMTDCDTWLQTDETTPPCEDPDFTPPFDTVGIKAKMMKLAESSILIGKGKINFKPSQVIFETGKYQISSGSFTPSAFPSDLANRLLEPPGAPADDYWAIRVKIRTDSDSKVAALFARIINQTETDISTYGLAYLSTSALTGVSGYAFEN